MLSRMHQKLGTAGFVVAIVALVAALTGAAFAAGGLTKQQEKQVKKIAKKYAGKPGKRGPAGPAGAQGPAGPKGNPGANGTNGTNGTDGTDGRDGVDGEDGMCTVGNPACELPSGSTLAGVWGTSGGLGVTNKDASGEEINTAPDISLVAISFVQRVSPAPTVLWEFEPAAGHVFAVELSDGGAQLYAPGAGSEEEAEEVWNDSCPGSADAPSASGGFLCIYNDERSNAFTPFEIGSTPSASLLEAANEFGVVVPWEIEARGFAKGSWAVTAE